MELFEIGGGEYYFDLDAISKYIRVEQDDKISLLEPEDKEDDGLNIIIDIPKWEMVKVLTETVLTDNSIVDDNMGIKGLENGMTIPFKISFNTLLKHKLIISND